MNCFLVRRATKMRASRTLITIGILIVMASIPLILRLRQPPLSPLPRPPDLLLRFGLIADIQYVDAKDAWDSLKTRRRFYRRGLSRLKEAVELWKAEKVDGVFQLGDLVDGSSLRLNQRDADFARILQVAAFLPLPWYHLVGNHERYSFGESEIREWTGRAANLNMGNDNYYRFSPSPAFMVVVLHSYEISVNIKENKDEEFGDGKIDRKNDYEFDRFSEARAILSNKNENDNDNSPKGLDGLNRRWVALNGGLGREQLSWFNKSLHLAKSKGQKVIVVSHVPLHPEALTDAMNLAWDYDRALDVIKGVKGVVVAALAGHDHEGGVHFSGEYGVLFFTLSSVLESRSRAFAVCDIFADRLDIRGFGDVKSASVKFVAS